MIELVLPFVLFVLFGQVVALSQRRMSPVASVRLSVMTLTLGFFISIPLLAHLSATWLFTLPELGTVLHRILVGGRPHLMDRNIFGFIGLVLLSLSSWRALKLLMNERRLRKTSGEGVVIVPDKDVYAYALPGRRSSVVLSEGLVQKLSQTELDIVIAHEMAHVSNRHDRLLLLGRICAIFNPFLVATMDRLRFSLERIADQAAVDQSGDPGHVARTIAKVALHHADANFSLGIASYGTLQRIEGLSVSPPCSRGDASLFAGVSLFGLSALLLVQWHHVIVAIADACGH